VGGAACGGVGVSSQVKGGCGLAERAVEARWEQQQAQVRMPPTARSSRYSACHKGMCIARKQRRQGREGKYMTARYNSPVRIGAGGLLLGRDDGFQVLLSSLLTRVLAV
jgi:hypothetical protein